MQFNVAQLLKEPVGSVRRYHLDEDAEALDDDLEFLSPLVGDLQLMRTNSGVLVTGLLKAAVRVTCNRCVEPIVMPLQVPIEESFRPLTEVETGRYLRPDEFEGDTNELEDAALLIDEHHILDAAEVIRQNIWLQLPMYPTCNWQGAGECPNLVAQRAAIAEQRATDQQSFGEEDDDTIPEGIDPRWAALLKFQESTTGKQ
ncbi:MAG: DUF177 domain-containing protein [Caldilineaceae bacterium]|nr:DUF177 domain-containing protein [Caldilineaceae bacterium]